MKAFVSYSSLDAAVANEIVSALEQNDIDCFIAPRDIRTGHVYAEEIVMALDSCQVVVLVLTENSNKSQHVLREIERAVSNNIPIISYRNEEIKLIPAMEYFLMSNQWLDNPWNGRHEELIEAVKELAIKYVPKDKTQTSESEVSKSHAAVSKLKRKKNKWKIVAVVAIALWLITLGVCLFLRNRDTDEGNASGGVADEVDNGSNDENSGPDEEQNEEKGVELKVGDIYTFGNYNDEAIVWWVVEVDDGIATLFSKDVLTMKGFEGAESGENHYTISGETKSSDRPFTPVENMEAYGSNDWEISSLRAWLNSSKINVEYIGQSPTAKSMCDHENEYSAEPGFLNGFTEDEIGALVITTISTEYHDWETGNVSVKETQDYVYLPTKADITLFQAIDINVYCEPTQQAIDNNGSTVYSYYCDWHKTDNSMYWLRDPYEDSFSEIYCVSTGHNDVMYDNFVAAVAGIGVRPILRVDMSKLSSNN